MFMVHKRIITCLIMLGIVITGCSQQEKNEPLISNKPIQEAVAPDSPQKGKLSYTTEVEADSNSANIDNLSNINKKQEPSEVQFTFYPSGPDFIKSIINERGKVGMTDKIRERFNLFARDYRLVYIPDMDYYESFFEVNQYAKSSGYNNFGFAAFYVLQYMRCPERMSDQAMQNAIQSLFVAKDSYKDIPHQAFRKLANYEDGYYSPWPEGGLNHDRMFYLLTGLDIDQEGSNVAYITMHFKSYYFNDPSYKPGENEKWLAEKSKKLGISDLQAAAKLIASGEMEELKGDSEVETTIYFKFSGQNQYGYNPRFVSSRNSNIE